MSLWLLLGAAWARCAPELPVTLKGTAPAGTTQVCAFFNDHGDSEGCTTPAEDGTFALGVSLGVGHRFSLLTDRCTIERPALAVVGLRSDEAIWRSASQVRSRDIQHSDDGWWIAIDE